MHHSITFGDKNTWTDWHLVPTSRPVINPPEVKTQYVDIPGADGSIDLTESLAGRPAFSDREGSIEFVVLNDFDIDGYNYNWITVYTDVMEYLHGKSMRMVLDDDPEYFYEGRFRVNSWKSDANHSTITIDYRVSPYKYLLTPRIPSIERGDIDVSDGANIDDVQAIHLTSWEKGSFNTSNGDNYTDPKVIRNQTKIGVATSYSRVQCATGYRFLMYGWDLQDNYIGAYKNDGTWSKVSSGWKSLDDFDLTTIPNYLVKIALLRSDSSPAITTSEGDQVTVYRRTDASQYARTTTSSSYYVGDIISVDGFKLNYFRYSSTGLYEDGKHENMTLYKGGRFTIPVRGYYRFSFAKGDGTTFSDDDLSALRSSINVYKGGKL